MGGITNVCICVDCASSYVTAKGVMKGEEKEGVGRKRKGDVRTS